ncbi:MAG: hypothetical protein F4039_07530 [Gammaproteobacteria bacterium]|nr:hypothetical protein [Gammaproteobacteria bacterium]MYF54021.1 hypothetical protein [Gammaproteobacteria bacterium]MYK43920.1 hypothetical protein [Gammaproteobacteria bacterium]
MKEQFLGIFLFPGAVFSTFKEKVPVFPVLITYTVAAFIFVGLSAFLISDEQIVELQETQADGIARIQAMLQRSSPAFPVSFEDFESGQEITLEESEEEFNKVIAEDTEHDQESNFQELYDTIYAEQLEKLTTPDAMFTARILEAIFNPVFALCGLALGCVLLATYYLIVGNMLSTQYGWSQWFGFSLWSLLPIVPFWLVADAVWVFNSSIRPENMESLFSPFSWIGIDQAICGAITLPLIYTIYIQFRGLQSWTNSTIPSLLLALLPWVIYVPLTAGLFELVEFLNQLGNQSFEEMSSKL